MSTLWRRWWRAFAVLLVVLLSGLAGEAFRSPEQVTKLVIDLRGPYDQNAVDRESRAYRHFSGNVIFVVTDGATALCTKTEWQGRGARPGELITINGYCPFPQLSHSTAVLDGPPSSDSLAAWAANYPLTLLRTTGRIYQAGQPEGSFAWWAALLTGGTLIAIVLAAQSLVPSRKHRSTPAPTVWPVPHTPPGGPVPHQQRRYEIGPAPPPPIPRQQPAPPAAVVDAPPALPPWEPPTPARVVLTPDGSSALPELARIVHEAGGRAVARTHIDPPGGYVAFGDVVVWGASEAGGVLPGEPVGVEYTGDPAAPLTVSPAPSRSVPEQGCPR